MSLVSDEAISLWKKAYQRAPRATTYLTILGLLIGVIGIVLGVRQDRREKAEFERKRNENLSYTQQVNALNNVQGSLNNLIQFVESEKLRLKESEDLINTLKAEQQKLKPVVEADRKTVEALLDLQSQRTERGVWRERWYGFGLGILASIFASIIISIITYFVKKGRRSSPDAPATA